MDMTKKINAILFVFLYVTVYFLAQLIAIVARPVSDTLIYLINGEHEFARLLEYFINQTEGQKLDMVYIYFASMLLTVLIIWLILFLRKKTLSSVIKKRRLDFKDIISALFFAYGLNVLATAIISIPALSDFIPSYESTMESIVIGDLFTMFLIVGLLAPAFEELFFRGIVFGELKDAGSFLFANIIQSVLFGVMHMNIIQGLYAAVVGFILGFIYYKTKNLYLTILTHIVFNASNILVTEYLFYAQSLPNYYLTGAIALSIGFWLILKKKTTN